VILCKQSFLGLGSISLAAMILALGVGQSGCAGCFSPLVVLTIWERGMVDLMGNEGSPLVTAAVAKEDGVWVWAGIMAAMTMRYPIQGGQCRTHKRSK